MMFGKTARFRSVIYGCLLSMFMASNTTASAGTVSSALTAAEFVTALGRSMVVVANNDGQNGRMTKVRLVANLSRMLNEVFGLINHIDDIQGTGVLQGAITPALYNGGWLAYDAAALLQYCCDDADECVLPENIVSDPMLDANIERITNVLLHDVLPLVETLAATVVAATGWAEDANTYRALRIRLQSITSLMRMLQVCFEHRGDAKTNWRLALLAAHTVVTIWEFLRDLKVPATLTLVGNNPVNPIAVQAVAVSPVVGAVAGDTGPSSTNGTGSVGVGTSRVVETHADAKSEEKPVVGAPVVLAMDLLKPPQEQVAPTASVVQVPEAKAEVKIPVGRDEPKVALIAVAPAARPVVMSTDSVSSSANAGASSAQVSTGQHLVIVGNGAPLGLEAERKSAEHSLPTVRSAPDLNQQPAAPSPEPNGTTQSTHASPVPPLRRLTSEDVREFLDLGGSRHLMRWDKMTKIRGLFR